MEDVMGTDFQERVYRWVRSALGYNMAHTPLERGMRHVEEALELGQSVGMKKADALRLVEYVFARPVGEPHQEIGGSIITLAALAQAMSLDMSDCGETELARCWRFHDKIREKAWSKDIKAEGMERDV